MNIKRLLNIFLLLLAICFLLQLLNWLHHRFVFGLNPFLGPVLLVFIILASIPFVIKYYRWQRKRWLVKRDNETAVLFAMGAPCLMISYARSGHATVDIHLHDTYYIISYVSIVLFAAFLFEIFCTMYYLFSKIFKRDLNIFLSRFHFWITFIGLSIIFSIRNTGQIINEPRRYIENNGWASYQHFDYLNRYILVDAILVAQLLFIFNIIYSLFNGSKLQAL
jgi:cytochrome c oxidase subunit 1